MTKSDYIKGLLIGEIFNGSLLNAALIYWHSGIPFEDAKGYLKTLQEKLNGTRDRSSVTTH
jgi:hypothetical protein